MNLLGSVLLLVAIVEGVNAQFPSECSCPDSCICSLADRTIDCVDQRLRHVPVEINSCSWPGITKIDLSGNRIRFVHELAFSLLSNITHLFLYDNLINEIDRSAFVGLDSLEYLFLDGNRLSTIPYTAFWSLRHLKRLLLYGNLLTDLPSGIFRYQRFLTRLALHENRLSVLHTEVFDDLPLLQELYLHDNHINDLSGAPFRSLRQLNTLYLNENRLTRLTRFDFLGLNRLSKLLLNDNQISAIEDDTFKTTLKLRYLHLESNRLTEVNLLVFSGPVELLELRLFNNQIQSISNGAFFRLRKLQKLALHNNQLTEINSQSFVGLDGLLELFLFNNRLRSLLNDSFVQSPLLQRLWLYSNEISCIEVAAFRGLGNLEVLQLGQNRLSYLPEDVFSFTPSLAYLLLYSNDFRSISNRPFRNLPSLVQLGLTSNSIEYFAEGALDGTNHVYYFQWSTPEDSNSLVCDCSALWLYQWMSSRQLISSVICSSPPEFRLQDIRSLKPASFGCSAASLRLSVSSGSEQHVVARNGCMRLTCSSSPRGPVQWSRIDGRPLRLVPDSCTLTSPCAGGGEGVLVVEGVREEDAGHYMCTAELQNQTMAHVCAVTVGDPPLLRESPRRVVLPHPGPVAKFFLNMTGRPWPEVTWYHTPTRGRGGVKLLQETGSHSRYIVSRNGTLVLTETVLEDEGTYTAVLSNGAGELTVNVTLSFRYEASCHTPCQNNGTCVDLSVCMCEEGFMGDTCETMIAPPTTPLTTAPPTTVIPTASVVTTVSPTVPHPPTSSTLDPDVTTPTQLDHTDPGDTVTMTTSGETPSDADITQSYDDADTTTDMEGLIDDEDYFITTSTPNQISGSGDSDTSPGSGEDFGSGDEFGSGHASTIQNGVRLERRRRKKRSLAAGVELGVVGDLQKETGPEEVVKTVATRKDQAKFELFRKIAVGATSNTTPPSRPTEHAQFVNHKYIDSALSEEEENQNPPIIYLYEEEDQSHPGDEDMHRI